MFVNYFYITSHLGVGLVVGVVGGDLGLVWTGSRGVSGGVVGVLVDLGVGGYIGMK